MREEATSQPRCMGVSSQIAALTLCSLLLSGCYVNQASYDPYSYSSPNPYTYWSYKKPPEECVPLHDAPDQSEPFTLGELIDLALHNSAQTESAWAQARIAAAQYGESEAPGFPQLTGQYTANRLRSITVVGPFQQNPASQIPFYISIWGPQLNLSYLVFDFGTQKATSEAARAALYYANWTQNQAIQSLVQTVTTNYYNYAFQKQLLISLEQDIETAYVTLDAAKVGLRSGLKDVSDVLQAETQYLQTNLALIAQRQQVVMAFAQLMANAGLPANAKLDTLMLPPVVPSISDLQNVDELVSTALHQRADLNAARAQVESAQYTLEAARRNLLPKVNFTFNIGRKDYTGGFTDGYDFNGQLALTFPIFQGFSLLNSIKVAKAEKELAEANLKQVELQVIQQIVSSHYGVKTAYESVLSAAQYLEAAEEQYAVALAQYKAGTASILDVVSAQSSLAHARAVDAQSRQQWFTSLSTLAYTTGIITDPAIAYQEAP